MIQNAVKLSCGNCGYSRHYVYQTPAGLVIECCECKSTTEVKAVAELCLVDCDDSKGGLCPLFNSRG